MKRRKLLWGGLAALGICSSAVLFAVNFQLYQVTSSDFQRVYWPSSTITWQLNPTASNLDTSSGVTVVNSLTDAFTTWQSAQYQSTQVNTLAFTQGADSTLTAPAVDCHNVIGFTDTSGFASGIIAYTAVTTVGSSTFPFQYSGGTCTGTCPNTTCIIDADIQFNPANTFATGGTPASGEYDLQSIATHEVGHLIGLDHSGIAGAVMYPYGDTNSFGVQRTLWVDDMIGSGVLYENSALLPLVGGIKGQVMVGGSPAFGAHVVAIDSTTGNTITDTLTDNEGNYHLRMLSGKYNVLVLPLGTSTSGTTANSPYTITNFHGFACGYSTNFPTCTDVPANPTNYTGKFY